MVVGCDALHDSHTLHGSVVLGPSQPRHKGAVYGDDDDALSILTRAFPAGGLLCHSLAIITDAAHMLSDVAGFLVGAIALVLTSRDASSRYSFGFGRAEVLGANPNPNPNPSPNPNLNPHPKLNPHPSPSPSPDPGPGPSPSPGPDPDHCS